MCFIFESDCNRALFTFRAEIPAVIEHRSPRLAQQSLEAMRLLMTFWCSDARLCIRLKNAAI